MNFTLRKRLEVLERLAQPKKIQFITCSTPPAVAAALRADPTTTTVRVITGVRRRA